MPGKLIFVSGLTGAGKTTLIGEALKNIDNLEVLLTYTTRPIRNGEENSYEYIFVDDKEYEDVKSQSDIWDETVYNNHKYASDAEKFINDLKNGKNVIVSVTPHIDEIRIMSKIYQTKPITIWINTDPKTAYTRISSDLNRSARVEDENIKYTFDIIFEPTGKLNVDKESFAKLINDVIAS